MENQWAEIAGQLIDRVVGKNMSMTYDFQQLTFDMPQAEGPGGIWVVSMDHKWQNNYYMRSI